MGIRCGVFQHIGSQLVGLARENDTGTIENINVSRPSRNQGIARRDDTVLASERESHLDLVNDRRLNARSLIENQKLRIG